MYHVNETIDSNWLCFLQFNINLSNNNKKKLILFLIVDSTTSGKAYLGNKEPIVARRHNSQNSFEPIVAIAT